MSTPPPGYARALRPDEQALFDELTRAQVLAGGVQIEVGVISWPSSHEPQLDWLPVAWLPAASSAADCYRARRRVLMQRRFFGVCKTCGQRYARGHMHSTQLCTACAEQYQQITF